MSKHQAKTVYPPPPRTPASPTDMYMSVYHARGQRQKRKYQVPYLKRAYCLVRETQMYADHCTQSNVVVLNPNKHKDTFHLFGVA